MPHITVMIFANKTIFTQNDGIVKMFKYDVKSVTMIWHVMAAGYSLVHGQIDRQTDAHMTISLWPGVAKG